MSQGLPVGPSNAYFKSLGLPLLADECSRNLSNRRVRTRTYSDLLGDIVSGVNTPWNAILDGVLKLDFEIAIPGRGEPKTRADVQAFRAKFATVFSRASDAIKAGATRETLASQMKTDDLGWQFNPQFYGQLYDELAKK